MIGSLFGRMTTDNSVTRIEQEGERRNVQNAVDLQVRMRQRHTMILEGDLDDAHEEINQKNKRIRELEKENERLKKLEAENQELKKVALDVIVDRRAIFNTLEYLNQKWGKKVVDVCEIDEVRVDEKRALFQDSSYIEKTSNEIDQFVQEHIKPKRGNKR